jgi:hypothetical protein
MYGLYFALCVQQILQVRKPFILHLVKSKLGIKARFLQRTNTVPTHAERGASAVSERAIRKEQMRGDAMMLGCVVWHVLKNSTLTCGD